MSECSPRNLLDRTAAAALALGLLICCRPAWANPVIRLPDPGSEAWQPLTFRKIPRHTRYEVVQVDGRPVLRAESDCAASGLVLPLEGIDLDRTPRLAWRWKVEEVPEVPDERVKEGDDFAARVYLTFRFDAERASLWESLRRRVAVRFYGKVIPGSALTYVWASHAAPGSDWPNPFSPEARVVVLRSGRSGEWKSEVVDVAADHRRLIGEPNPSPLALALMSDSDNTCQRARAYFADFRFLGAAE